MKFGFSLLVILAWATALSASPALPLQDGEQLTYRVAWAIVPGAGKIKINAAMDTTRPTPALVVTTNTATRGFAKALLPFEAKAESFYDAVSGQLLELRETATQRRKKTDRSVMFDYVKREALYAKVGGAEPPRPLPIPEGNPSDLIMALLQTRTWNLQPGQSRDALVLFDDDFYELTIHALRYENVQTALGKFRTLVLEPRMDKTAPKGMFKKGASVHVWIAQDEHHLPVKFEVEFKIGTGTATLESYTPPPGASALASSDTTDAPPANAKDPRP